MLAHIFFPQNYNSLIQISIRWKKYLTLYVRFPLVNHGLDIKEVTRYIANNHVITFVILLKMVPKTRKENIADILC